jgi:hypothetical protein
LICRVFLFALVFCHTVEASDDYKALFQARFEPETGTALASIRISQDSTLLRLVDLTVPASHYSDFTGDGEIQELKDRVVWTVPAEGGTLHYRVKIDNRRGKAHDARITDTWAIMRLDDLFPRAHVTARKGSRSLSSLRLSGPEGWVFESRYGPAGERLRLPDSDWNFNRPTGWLAAGQLGIRRELIRNRSVVIAGPPGQAMRRLDTLAFLHWTMPRLLKIFDEFPDRLLIVGARDEMWRGALSGPASLYIHTERPLISENGTSTLVHELVHVATSGAHSRDDWLVEGLAEYYGLEILRRSGGISQKRFEQTMHWLADWADREGGRLRSPSTGPHTARAVLLLWNLATELKESEAGNLDYIAQELADSGDITGQNLLLLVEEALGGKSTLLRKALAE